MNAAWSLIRNWWCYKTHPAPMWPVGGKYRCPKCLRTFPVPWEERQPSPVMAREARAAHYVPATQRS